MTVAAVIALLAALISPARASDCGFGRGWTIHIEPGGSSDLTLFIRNGSRRGGYVMGVTAPCFVLLAVKRADSGQDVSQMLDCTFYDINSAYVAPNSTWSIDLDLHKYARLTTGSYTVVASGIILGTQRDGGCFEPLNASSNSITITVK